MTPKQIAAARAKLEMSANEFAAFVGVASGRTVRRWEAGDMPIPGPLVEYLALLFELGELRRQEWIKRRMGERE